MNFPFYKQTTEYTCGPACVIMALVHFGKLRVCSEKVEKLFWHRSRLSPFFDTSPFGLSEILASNKLDVTIVMPRERPTKAEFDILFDLHELPLALKKDSFNVFQKTSSAHRCHAKKLGVKFLKENPSISIAKRCLDRGNVIIALIATNYFKEFFSHNRKKESYEHWVVITDIDSSHVYVTDPYAGKIRLEKLKFIHALSHLRKKFKIEPAFICVGKR